MEITDPEKYNEVTKLMSEVKDKAYEIDKIYDDERVREIGDGIYGTWNRNNAGKDYDNLEDELSL